MAQGPLYVAYPVVAVWYRALLSSSVLGIAIAVVACRGRGGSGDDAGPAQAAAKELGPPHKPPPLRAPHPAAPQLPDLPSLADHEPPASPPADADLGGHPCRAVWTGSDVAPLACAKALLFGSDQAGGGATLLVSRDALARDPQQLPAVVDHRRDGTEGPVRDQGSAPACTAFATAAAVDHALLRWAAGAPPVSVMEIWARYHSPQVGTSLSSNVGLPLGPESQWPFTAAEAVSWVPCAEYAKPPKAGCDRPVDDARLRTVEGHPVGQLTETQVLGAPDVALLQAELAAGQDVIVALELPSAFVPKGRPGARYVPDYGKSAGADAGHALVLAGYARLPHGVYFLAHNSWGVGWGDGGYAWIHEKTLTHWSQETIAIDAEPEDRSAGGSPLRSRGQTTCDADLVPDSIRGTCAPACPDGSPRHDDVCPVAGQCPAGYVNLTGSCVLAAPAIAGADSHSGIAWKCGPGGCSYVLPRASDPTCTGSSCRASCPAPDFRVARMGNSLVCVE
jgi:hypothetical protein